ncbi:MAG TPA: glycosyltransferase family 2 protein [Vicinamibacteria bacterium]|nr:glycosyltransferase family 2 protein [Vicinamibacteria bacterium]
MPPSVSVVVPMYNEQPYVERAVSAARDVLEKMGADWEVIVVDDASSDRTGAIAEELARADGRVKVVHNLVNRQLGGSLRAGWSRAVKDLILYTDADLPADLGELPRAIHLLEYQQADLLAAYRFDRTAEGWWRGAMAFGYNLMVRALFDLPVRDVNFAFKLFRRSLLERIVLTSEGSFIDAELLLRARHAGAHVIQMGVDYFPRRHGPSKLSSPAVVAGIVREMARYWGERR